MASLLADICLRSGSICGTNCDAFSYSMLVIQTRDISGANHSVKSGLYLINSLKTGIYLD